jgi:ABC-type multidrug transport system fused ATPase/permease subunit
MCASLPLTMNSARSLAHFARIQAIARALLVNPRILLLDEATSALDAESEHEVQQALDQAVVGRTVIVVAHRLSTVRDAHQIVVMDPATHRMVDVGTHDVLVGRCSIYQDLIKRQAGGSAAGMAIAEMAEIEDTDM